MKKILSFIFSLCLLVGLVYAAPPMPAPVKGNVVIAGQYLSGYTVTVTNERTGDKLTLITDNGMYLFDMSEFPNGYIAKSAVYVGDTITISLGSDSVSFTAEEFPYLVNDLVIGTAPPIEEEEDTQTTTSDEEKKSTILETFYGELFSLKVGHTKLSKLLDDSIKFDGKTYDVEEYILIDGVVQTSMDDVDFGITPYLVVEKVEYQYIFKDELPIDDVTLDETLEVSLLGKYYEISDLDEDGMTFVSGEEFFLAEGDSSLYDGKYLKVETIGSDYAFISYNGAQEKLEEGESAEIGGIEVYAKDILEDEDGPDYCTIRIATDVEQTIESGDDYYESDLWEWVIDMDASPQVIKVVNQETWEDLDEDTKPIAVGEKISLPEDYADIVFKEINEGERTELDIRVKNDYLLIDGDFTYGTDDYTKIYLNNVGFYDYDEEEFITTEKVQIGDSEYYLEMGSLVIGKLKVLLDMTDILYDGVSFAGKDDSFLDYFGIIFKNPEDAVDDKNGFRVSVPEERPEAVILVGKQTEVIEEEEEECPICNCPTCPICVCPTCDECVVCEECPETTDDNNELIIGAIALILGSAGGAGIMFKYGNNKMFTGKNTGVKFYRGQDGTLKIFHKHPGTVGYHNPEISHRKPETHPKGMVDVGNKYQKNEQGEWEFVG
uniref:Uncharacterized protein n=1 Tax=viral metagenome TaxID=1070528 RepID=A0A6M3JZ15_9ZZZZ